MTRHQRLRRVAILCCSCVRNLAYYRAGWQDRNFIFENTPLQRTINSNFIDMAVLDWCKLFGPKEKHSWHKVVTSPEFFSGDLLKDTGLDQCSFEKFLGDTRRYRDKFVAHLDSEPVMYPPMLDVPKRSTIFYYAYLLRHENDGCTFEDGPSDLAIYFDACSNEARQSLYSLEK